jgi:hypothetical protein
MTDPGARHAPADRGTSPGLGSYDPAAHRRRGGSLLRASTSMTLLALLRSWLPLIGPLVAGVVGGREAGTPPRALGVAILPAVPWPSSSAGCSPRSTSPTSGDRRGRGVHRHGRVAGTDAGRRLVRRVDGHGRCQADGHHLVSLTPDGTQHLALRSVVRARTDLVETRGRGATSCAPPPCPAPGRSAPPVPAEGDDRRGQRRRSGGADPAATLSRSALRLPVPRPSLAVTLRGGAGQSETGDVHDRRSSWNDWLHCAVRRGYSPSWR